MNTGLGPIKDFLKVDELAHELQVSVTTVYRLVTERRIPFFKVGKQLRFNIIEVKKSLKVKDIDQC